MEVKSEPNKLDRDIKSEKIDDLSKKSHSSSSKSGDECKIREACLI